MINYPSIPNFLIRAFKYRLLSIFDDIDNQTDGLLINSENFQALNLLQTRYKEKVQCIYIDPPYNTDASAIMYRNGYKDSSWASLMQDRLLASHKLNKQDGMICLAIDDEEVLLSRKILSNIYEKDIGVAVVRSNPVGRKTKGKFSPNHEYALFYGKSERSIPNSLIKSNDGTKRYPHTDTIGRYSWLNFIRTGSNDLREDSPRMYYPIVLDKKNNMRIPKMEWIEEKREYQILESIRNEEIMIYPDKKENNRIIQKNWQRGYERFSKELDEYRVRRDDNNIKIDFKARMDESALPVTWWGDNKYASSNHGATEMKKFFNQPPFSYPKALNLVKDCIKASGLNFNHACVLDYFAGSGTTAHAVINLNREDGGTRKYILVEMGEYFDSVTKPRVQKAAYAKDWKDGKPTSREGVSHCIKYFTLEQYEDTLDNLEFNKVETDLNFTDSEKTQYTLRYMLDVETRDSLLNIKQFDNPFAYQLKITRDDDTKEVAVDLLETFNYLLGLRVQKIRAFDDIITVRGLDPLGEECLIIWRNHHTTDNNRLNKWFQKYYHDFDGAFIYCNGDNLLSQLKTDTQNWRVVLTEAEFHRLMFDTTH